MFKCALPCHPTTDSPLLATYMPVYLYISTRCASASRTSLIILFPALCTGQVSYYLTPAHICYRHTLVNLDSIDKSVPFHTGVSRILRRMDIAFLYSSTRCCRHALVYHDNRAQSTKLNPIRFLTSHILHKTDVVLVDSSAHCYRYTLVCLESRADRQKCTLFIFESHAFCAGQV